MQFDHWATGIRNAGSPSELSAGPSANRHHAAVVVSDLAATSRRGLPGTLPAVLPLVNLPGKRLEPTAASTKKQEENHNEQDQTESATAVVAKSGAHVIAAAAEKQQENHKNED